MAQLLSLRASISFLTQLPASTLHASTYRPPEPVMVPLETRSCFTGKRRQPPTGSLAPLLPLPDRSPSCIQSDLSEVSANLIRPLEASQWLLPHPSPSWETPKCLCTASEVPLVLTLPRQLLLRSQLSEGLLAPLGSGLSLFPLLGRLPLTLSTFKIIFQSYILRGVLSDFRRHGFWFLPHPTAVTIYSSGAPTTPGS